MDKYKINEADLLQASIDGNSAAFESMVRKYQSLICAITYSSTRNVEKSEELAHETFVRAWQNLKQLKDLTCFKPWLCTIARNTVKNHFRSQNRDILHKAAPIDHAESAHSDVADPSANLISKEQQAVVALALEHIPETYRQPLVLFYRQDKSIKQVAEQLDLSEENVRTRLSRGRKMLKDQVTRMVENTLSSTAPGKAFTAMVMASVAGLILKSTGASAVAGISSTTSTGTAATTTTGTTAMLSSVGTKVIVAAVIASIGIVSTIAYLTLKKSDKQEPALPSVAVVDQQNTETGQLLPALEVSDIRQNSVGGNSKTVPENTLASENNTENNANHDTIDNTAIVDRDNDQKGVFGLKVVAKETGRAIEGANVNVSISSVGGKNSKGKTDKFGRYNIQLGKDLTSLNVKVTVEGRPAKELVYEVQAKNHIIPLNYTMQLEEGTPIGGIVKNELGEPVKDASVLLTVTDNRKIERPFMRDHSVMTDAEGIWFCDIMPSDLDGISIKFKHLDYMTISSSGMSQKITAEKLRELSAVSIMEKGIDVVGVVVDASGNPIANATVDAGYVSEYSITGETKTDEEGQFVFFNAPSGEWTFKVTAKGMVKGVKKIKIEPDPEVIEFVLAPGQTIKGRVVDVEGTPLSGATIWCFHGKEIRGAICGLVTGKDGRFQWVNAPMNDVFLTVIKGDYVGVDSIKLDLSKLEHEIILGIPVKVSGTVVDAETGKPVESFKVSWGVNSEKNSVLSWYDHEARYFKNGSYNTSVRIPFKEMAVKVQSKGYKTSVSTILTGNDREFVFDFVLNKAETVSGTVYLPNGEPAEGVELLIAYDRFFIVNGRIQEKNRYSFTQTDPNGLFSFTLQDKNYLIFALDDQGWGKIRKGDFEGDAEIILQPWSTVKGKVYLGKEPDPGQRVSMSGWADGIWDPHYSILDECVTDEFGEFEFNRVLSGQKSISRQIVTRRNAGTTNYAYTDREGFEVDPGQTVEVNVGGKGRPVVGRFIVPDKYKDLIDWNESRPDVDVIPDVVFPKKDYPEGFVGFSAKEKREWLSNWHLSDRIQKYVKVVLDAQDRSNVSTVIIDDDGEFRIESVQSEKYRFICTFKDKPERRYTFGKPLGRIEFEFTVPEIPGGYSEQELDLGDRQVDMFVEIGEQVPDFQVKDVDGKTIKLSDYRGKIVLLDPWYSHQSAGEGSILEEVTDIYKHFGDDKRFVILTVCSVEDIPPELMKKYIEYYNMKWNVGLFSDYKAKRKAFMKYGVINSSGRLLIGANGELLGRDLKGQKLRDAITKNLKTLPN